MKLTDQQIDQIGVLLGAAQRSLDRIREILAAREDYADLAPLSASNKNGKFLSERGIEVCYRLFDNDENPYAVARLMNISYTAAANRRASWEKAGGKKRQPRSLT
ncbi:hypothetical protein [Rhizobium leguminosarum]|uniref:hypothetical protein n=1 Tax=Rhizobium leguminosarum TaxID=384 RepID=UPI003F972ACD